MTRAIIRFLIIFFIVAFVAVWLLGGGLEQIKVSTTHYRNPFDSHNIFEFVLGTGSSSPGEIFHLPGQPSNLPGGPSLENATNTVYVDSGADTEAAQEAQLQNLKAQYEQLQAQAAAQQR